MSQEPEMCENEPKNSLGKEIEAVVYVKRVLPSLCAYTPLSICKQHLAVFEDNKSSQGQITKQSNTNRSSWPAPSISKNTVHTLTISSYSPAL